MVIGTLHLQNYSTTNQIIAQNEFYEGLRHTFGRIEEYPESDFDAFCKNSHEVALYRQNYVSSGLPLKPQ
jgi:hypothetical protein